MIALPVLALQLALVAPAVPEATSFDAGRQNQMALTFSPDARTAWWTAWNGTWGQDNTEPRTIYTSRWTNNAWSTPEPAPFTGEFNDDDPFVSPDGEWLYFVSTRPANAEGEETRGDIWRYRLRTPNRLERLPVSSDAVEYSPVVTPSGTLYFASDREDGYGQGDLYRAAALGNGFAEPEPLGPALNHPTGEWNLWVASDEREIIFEASSRTTNVSTPGDLYYSWLTVSGWTPAIPITTINEDSSELMPRLHPNREHLYYTTAPIGGHARVVSTNWTALRDEVRASFSAPLLVANRSSHDVAVVDLGHGMVTRRIPTGEGPHLLSNVEGNKVLATGYGVFPEPHDDPVTLIEIDTGKTSVVDLGSGSEGALVVDGRLWVANVLDGTLSIVDLAQARQVHRSPRICSFPIALGAGGNDVVWLACFGSSELVALSRGDYAPVRRVPVTGAPLNLLVHPERDLVYVSLPRANAVEEIDLVTGKAIRRIHVGIEPDGLRWATGSRSPGRIGDVP